MGIFKCPRCGCKLFRILDDTTLDRELTLDEMIQCAHIYIVCSKCGYKKYVDYM